MQLDDLLGLEQRSCDVLSNWLRITEHIEARQFFVQQFFRERKLRLEKVCDEVNPADLGTTMLAARTLKILTPLAAICVGDEWRWTGFRATLLTSRTFGLRVG